MGLSRLSLVSPTSRPHASLNSELGGAIMAEYLTLVVNKQLHPTSHIL